MLTLDHDSWYVLKTREDMIQYYYVDCGSVQKNTIVMGIVYERAE